MQDSEIKNLHVVIPMTLQVSSRRQGQQDAASAGGVPGKKRKQDTKNKGKVKGSGPRVKTRTSDGRLICYKYNYKDEECTGACGMLHVCQYCLKTHPRYECTLRDNAASKGDGQ